MVTKRNGTPRSADSVLGVPSLELVQGVLSRIPGTHSLAVGVKFAGGEFQQGAELRPNPRDYDNPDEYALALLSCSLFRKYPGLPGSERKAELAISKWLECEETCRSTNKRIEEFRIGQQRADLHEAFRLARKKIQNLLGPFRWLKPAKFFNFGPGSTTRLPFSKRHLPYKYGDNPETTFDNLASAVSVIGLSPVWCHASGGYYTSIPLPCVKIVEESKVTTVPKDAFIDRVIAIEPDMNMFIQKGFGGLFRSRLKQVGINLNDQTLNQVLARSASLGSLATIDLSSASDTISYELVKELLPPDWFEALLSCRTHSVKLPSGGIVHLQKFSSMGNGFTFELESLIFWALCSSVAKSTIGREGLRVSVYGDDIITTVEDYPAVVDLLEFCGFSVNTKKSYADGPYRESCGKHYFYGHDVTPITVTKEITHVSQLLLLCNNLIRWSIRTGSGSLRNSSVRIAYEYGVQCLPKHFQRPRLPDGYGDGALIGPFDAARPQRSSWGWDGWRVSGVLLPKQSYRRSSGVATLAAALSRLEKQQFCPMFFTRGMYAPRDEVCRQSLGYVSTRRRERPDLVAGRNTGILNVEDVQSLSEDDIGTPPRKGTSFIPTLLRMKVGKVFVSEWCDIGPWDDQH